MDLKERKLKGVYEIDPPVFEDIRGVFIKGFDYEVFSELGLNTKWLQENHSCTFSKGTIRGFHLQIPPFSESKLIRCIKGKLLNVFVDLRIGSETFGEWDAIELSSENRKMIYLPEMFANAFCIMENNTELIYKSSNVFRPDFERGILWNDQYLNVIWPFMDPILSEKDRNNDSYLKIIKELEEKIK